MASLTLSASSGEELPRNFEPSRMCTIRSGSNPINLAQVASAATGSSASTIFPRERELPLRGPLPIHGHNAVCDNEVDRNCGAYIKDALLNAFPMEDVLRPSADKPTATFRSISRLASGSISASCVVWTGPTAPSKTLRTQLQTHTDG